MTIEEIKKNINNNVNVVSKSIDLAKKNQDKYNSFVTIIDNPKSNSIESPLKGIPYALKDNVSTKGILTTASSNILKDYIPVYDATVYEKLKNSGAVLIGKTVMDELAMGGTGTTGHTGVVYNPLDDKRLVGGSSSGSATSVALGIVPFSIGTDTGDSIRKPASYVGIVGYKPTYGLVSRYGIIPYSSSLDHVGILANNTKDIATVLNIIAGHDPKDMTSLKNINKNYLDTIENNISNKKLFYIKEIIDININNDETKEIINNFYKTVDKIKQMGLKVEEVSIDKQLLSAIYPSYITISCAESTSNNANLNGLSFGLNSNEKTYQERIIDSRTKGFSELIKRRFILGSYVLRKENQEKLFLNACRIRRMIVDKINQLFKQYDALILPTTATVAPFENSVADKLSDEYLLLDSHLIIGNFGGYPSITIPNGTVSHMPIGLSITGKVKDDDIVLNIANMIEKGDKNV